MERFGERWFKTASDDFVTVKIILICMKGGERAWIYALLMNMTDSLMSAEE